MEGKLLYTNPKFKTISEVKSDLKSKQRKILINKMRKKEKKLNKRKQIFEKNPELSDPELIYE